MDKDPLALQDSFALLPPQLQRAWASSAAGRALTEVLAGAQLVAGLRNRVKVLTACARRRRRRPTPDLSRPLEVNIALDIRLVGFDGDGCVCTPFPGILAGAGV